MKGYLYGPHGAQATFCPPFILNLLQLFSRNVDNILWTYLPKAGTAALLFIIYLFSRTLSLFIVQIIYELFYLKSNSQIRYFMTY